MIFILIPIFKNLAIQKYLSNDMICNAEIRKRFGNLCVVISRAFSAPSLRPRRPSIAALELAQD